MKNRVQRLPLFCLAVTLCLSACGKTDSEQQGASVPFGTYVYTYEDGSTSQITVDAHTFRIRNGDYSSCASFAIASRIFAASAEAQKEGLQLSDAEKSRIIDEANHFDFASYDGLEVPYDLEELYGTDVNLNAKNENGEPIWGLGLTYYGDDRTIGFGDGYYVLQE